MRQINRSSTLSSTLIRFNSSIPRSPRETLQPTTFSEKSAPKTVHDRPEQIRGFPPTKSGPQWERSVKSETVAEPSEEAFDGPSKPRLVYARRPRRDLPDFTVSDFHVDRSVD